MQALLHRGRIAALLTLLHLAAEIHTHIIEGAQDVDGLGHHVHPLTVKVAEGQGFFLVHAALDGGTGYNHGKPHKMVLHLPQGVIRHFSALSLLRLAHIPGKLLYVPCCDQCSDALLQLGGNMRLRGFPYLEQRRLKRLSDGQTVFIVAQQNVLFRDHDAVHKTQQKADRAF